MNRTRIVRKNRTIEHSTEFPLEIPWNFHKARLVYPHFPVLRDRTYKFVAFFPLLSCRFLRSIILASSSKSRHLNTVSLRFIPAYFAMLLTDGKHVLSFPAKAHNTAYINAQFEGNSRFAIFSSSSRLTFPYPCFPICYPVLSAEVDTPGFLLSIYTSILLIPTRGGSFGSSWAVFSSATLPVK